MCVCVCVCVRVCVCVCVCVLVCKELLWHFPILYYKFLGTAYLLD